MFFLEIELVEQQFAMGLQKKDFLFLITYKDQQAANTIFLTSFKLSGGPVLLLRGQRITKVCELDCNKAIDKMMFYSNTLAFTLTLTLT